jgi:ABC-type sulfate/molybdate transport systems ATPase subunit
MIETRISKRIAPSLDSAGLSLDIEFQARPGITALFGTAGTGKTLTFDAIAGFVRPDAGRIMLDDRILFDAVSRVHLAPQQRNCGYVLQQDGLFPNMTLRENLVFAANRLPRLERHRRVSETVERFRLTEAAGRRPQEVSRGETIRGLLARALISAPQVLLLDEPSRGLDAPSRTELYRLLRAVRGDFRFPILLATQDLEECFQLADEMLVLRDGRIAQSGRPREILEQPASVEVARLLGITNLFQAEITALDPGRNTSRLRFQEHELTGTYFPGHLLGDRVWLCVRAGDLRATGRNGARVEANQVPAKLLCVSEMAQSVCLEFSGDISVEVARNEFDQQKDNKDWLVEFPPAALRVL